MRIIRDGLYGILERDHPQTVRGVFYQAVTLGLIPKTEEAYKGTVVRLLCELRKDGVVPYTWLADGTRWMRISSAYDGIESALYDAWRYYRHDVWADLADYVEVWCEKDAMAGVLHEETDQWTVPLMVSRGFASLSFLYSAGQTIAHKRRQGRTTYIYYFGDLDPSGISISQTIERGLREYSGNSPVNFERVAVTPEQVRIMGLPTRPTKRTDTRAKNWIGDSVELDAIPAHALKMLVRGCILNHIPDRVRNNLKTVEQNEKNAIYELYEMTRSEATL